MNTKLLNHLDPIALHNEALAAAFKAQQKFLDEHGELAYCGFAWVELYVDGRSPFIKALVKAGIAEKGWGKPYIIWNPTKTGTQSMDVKEAASHAYAKVFQQYGVTAYMGSRPD